MKPRTAVLVAVLVPTLACALGGDENGSGATPYDQPDIRGIWMREEDGYYVVREFYEGPEFTAMGDRSTKEWYYPVGDEPIEWSHGLYFVSDGYTMPGGTVVEDALYVYPDEGPIYYDRIVDVSDDTLVLQGLYDDAPVEYTSVDELP